MGANRDDLPESTPREFAGEDKPAGLAGASATKLSSPAAPASQAVVARRYPKPPAFPKRLLRMCLRPEEWAEAARYPLWTTLLLVLVAIVLSAAALGIGEVQRETAAARAFAASYDQSYPPLFLDSNGILSAKPALKEPLTILLHNGAGGSSSIVVDPTGATTLDSIKTDLAILVTDKTITVRMLGLTIPAAIKDVFEWDLPPTGQTLTLDGKWLDQEIQTRKLGVGIATVAIILIAKTISNGLWVLLMVFFGAPMAMVGAAMGPRGLAMPRRIAYRIAAAVTIPLVVFAGIAGGLGYFIFGVIPVPQLAVLFWFLAGSALAFWAGNLARRIFGPPAGQRRAV